MATRGTRTSRMTMAATIPIMAEGLKPSVREEVGVDDGGAGGAWGVVFWGDVSRLLRARFWMKFKTVGAMFRLYVVIRFVNVEFKGVESSRVGLSWER